MRVREQQHAEGERAGRGRREVTPPSLSAAGRRTHPSHWRPSEAQRERENSTHPLYLSLLPVALTKYKNLNTKTHTQTLKKKVKKFLNRNVEF